MSRSVKYGDVPVRRRERLHGNVHRYTPFHFEISTPAILARLQPKTETDGWFCYYLPLAFLGGTVKLPRPAETAFANLTARPFVRNF